MPKGSETGDNKTHHVSHVHGYTTHFTHGSKETSYPDLHQGQPLQYYPHATTPFESDESSPLQQPLHPHLLQQPHPAVSATPADLPIVREIQTSKLKVNDFNLTADFFRQLSHECLSLCLDICPHPMEVVQQESVFRAVLDVARRVFPEAALYHFGSTAHGFSLAGAGNHCCFDLSARAFF
jgi:DNA polymerase sigma